MLTTPRQAVFDLIKVSGSPLGAYDIIAQLSSADYQVKPPTVYRALDYLLKAGMIHKIHASNKYIACGQGEHTKPSMIFSCNSCDHTQEITLDKTLAKSIFKSLPSGVGKVLEVDGACDRCQKSLQQ